MTDELGRALTAAEWKVMKIVWRHRECAARDVVGAAEREHGWSSSTTKTLLRRLVDKGSLTTRAVGNSFLYVPSAAAVPLLLNAADALLDQVLDGTTGLVLSHMVRRCRLTARELTDLRALLDAQSPTEEAP